MKLVPLIRAGLLVSAVALLPATTAGLAAVDGRSAPQFNRLITVYQLVKVPTSRCSDSPSRRR